MSPLRFFVASTAVDALVSSMLLHWLSLKELSFWEGVGRTLLPYPFLAFSAVLLHLTLRRRPAGEGRPFRSSLGVELFLSAGPGLYSRTVAMGALALMAIFGGQARLSSDPDRLGQASLFFALALALGASALVRALFSVAAFSSLHARRWYLAAAVVVFNLWATSGITSRFPALKNPIAVQLLERAK